MESPRMARGRQVGVNVESRRVVAVVVKGHMRSVVCREVPLERAVEESSVVGVEYVRWCPYCRWLCVAVVVCLSWSSCTLWLSWRSPRELRVLVLREVVISGWSWGPVHCRVSSVVLTTHYHE